MSASVSRQNLARAGTDVVDHAIISFHLLWSPCRSWLLFVITCGYVGGPIFGRGALEMGRGWSPRNALPTRYHAKFGRYTSYGDPSENFRPLCPAFQDHSRSSEPTNLNELLMTYNNINSDHNRPNCGPISYRFRDKGNFDRNSQIFPVTVHLTLTLKAGRPLNGIL